MAEKNGAKICCFCQLASHAFIAKNRTVNFGALANISGRSDHAHSMREISEKGWKNYRKLYTKECGRNKNTKK